MCRVVAVFGIQGYLETCGQEIDERVVRQPREVATSKGHGLHDGGPLLSNVERGNPLLLFHISGSDIDQDIVRRAGPIV
jgi:hypothetical protein